MPTADQPRDGSRSPAGPVPQLTELAQPPGLTASYARALAPKRPGRAMAPDRRLILRDVLPEPVRLARYVATCGFTRDDRLPVSYPHLVAFPLTLALMSRRDFPFPLPGLVHLTNRIEHRRPLSPGERLTYQVGVERPYPHAKGTAFDVHAEAGPDGEVAWRSVSTYLHRGRPAAGMRPQLASPGADTPERADVRAPLASATTYDQGWHLAGSAGRTYGAVSGDRNPIHLHPLTARLFGFRRPLAHGMWTKARCLAALEEELPDAYRVSVDFLAPVLLPAEARFRAAPAGPHPAPEGAAGWVFELSAAGFERPRLQGRIDVLPTPDG